MALSCDPLCDTWNYLTVFVTCLYLNKAILSAYNREECDVFKDAAVSQNRVFPQPLDQHVWTTQVCALKN